MEQQKEVDSPSEDECSSQHQFPDTTLAMNFSSAGGLEFRAEVVEVAGSSDVVLDSGRPTFSEEKSKKKAFCPAKY